MNANHHPQSSPRPRISPAVGLVFLLILALGMARPAAATSYVPMSDRALADRAPAIAVVTVQAVEPSPAQGPVATDYLVQVEQVIKGYVGASTVVVRRPGGVRADGVGLKIWGAPELVAGERVLLFLTPYADGTLGIEGLMLGAFHLRTAGGVTVALRDLSEAQPVALTAGAKLDAVEPLRDAGRFLDWLGDRAIGLERPADYALSATSLPSEALRKFARINAADGKSPRWFRFDGGQSATWYSYSSGQPGLTAEATHDAFRSAVDAWTSDPTSNILYSYAGTTGATGGFRGADRVNAILYDDPRGDVPGSFDCVNGGVLALGGPYFNNSLRADQHEIFEADIVVQDGTRCFFENNPSGAAEVFAHELGHTLGFQHSADREAVMYSKAKNDGRGPRLGSDDRIGASQLYGDGSYHGEDLPAPPPAGAGGQIELKGKVASRTSVRLDWKSSVGATTGFEVGIVLSDGSIQRLVAVKKTARNVVVKGLAANTPYEFRICGMLADGSGVDSNSIVLRTKK